MQPDKDNFMKKFLVGILIFILSCYLVLISQTLIQTLVKLGNITNDSNMLTLYKILSSINWGIVIIVAGIFLVLSIIGDIMTSVILGSYNFYKNSSQFKNISILQEIFSDYFRKYKRIHIFYFLLTIFFTIAVTTPAQIMNTFTAILSISLFVISVVR